MKAFLKFIGKLVVVVVLLLYFFDAFYTYVYNHSVPRNKNQYILSLKNDSIDYVFLGSSRVENFIVTKEIERQTNKKALNLGTQGAKLDDILIYLKLLVDKGVKSKKVFIQIDYIFNFESNSDIVKSQSVPYINTNSVIDNYLKEKEPNYFYYKNMPFYKYAINDYRLGFREMFSSLIKKKTKQDYNDGFMPLFGKYDNSEMVFPEKIYENNASFQEIDLLCKKNKIDVYYFCSPCCSNTKNIEYLDSLKLKLPNFYNFSKAIKNDKYFKNCSHLNEEGARLFTNIFIDEMLLNN